MVGFPMSYEMCSGFSSSIRSTNTVILTVARFTMSKININFKYWNFKVIYFVNI